SGKVLRASVAVVTFLAPEGLQAAVGGKTGARQHEDTAAKRLLDLMLANHAACPSPAEFRRTKEAPAEARLLPQPLAQGREETVDVQAQLAPPRMEVVCEPIAEAGAQ